MNGWIVGDGAPTDAPPIAPSDPVTIGADAGAVSDAGIVVDGGGFAVTGAVANTGAAGNTGSASYHQERLNWF